MTVFREATEDDLVAIVGLLADDALGAAREQVETPLPDCYAAGFRTMRAQGGVIILAVDGADVLGCLQLNVVHGVAQKGVARAQVEAVRVAAAHRSRGVGAAMMVEAMRRARLAGCGLMQLTTNLSRTDARRFYERLGFRHSHAGMKLELDQA